MSSGGVGPNKPRAARDTVKSSGRGERSGSQRVRHWSDTDVGNITERYFGSRTVSYNL